MTTNPLAKASNEAFEFKNHDMGETLAEPTMDFDHQEEDIMT